MDFAETDDTFSIESRTARLQDAFGDWVFPALDELEIAFVGRVVASARRNHLGWIAAAMTLLGNGWLYVPLSLVLIVTGRIPAPLRFLSTAAASLAAAFLVYPMLKSLLSRTRPCDYDPSLVTIREPLDHYSCPSGHSMTIVAYCVALVFAWPPAIIPAVMLCALMGWSRIAMGHHYPSDVILGGVLGAAVSVPVSLFVF